MKEIYLNNGMVALVDDSDYEYLNQFNWQLANDKFNAYAKRKAKTEKGWRIVLMHREILGLTPSDKEVVDHKNRNGLDNRKDNLRKCTRAQNNCNKKSKTGSESKYVGVSINKKKYPSGKITKRWLACIRTGGRTKTLGRFPLTPCGEILAALKYDEAAMKYHGEFANLNFKRI